jgi:L-fuculose-phosphate aldolase
MAFAVTDAAFDSRTIPESYIMLRTVRRLPYFATVREIDRTAAAFDAKSPVALVDNQCVIVTGATLLGAFDRLEVLEYSARAVIDARDIWPVAMISDEEVKEIERAFHLA